MSRPRYGLAVLLVPIVGCQALNPLNLLFKLALVDQQQNLAGVKTVVGGNAERAILGNINTYFGPFDLGEPIVLDLATGARSPTGVDLSSIDAQAVQTDGEFLVWSDELYYANQLHVLNIETGARSELLTERQVAGVTVDTWVLNDGRIIGAGWAEAANDSVGSGAMGDPANVIVDLRSGAARRVPSFTLPQPAMVVASTAFVVQLFPRQQTDADPAGGGPPESRLFEINIETGESRFLATFPAGIFYSGVAMPSRVVLQSRVDPRLVVAWYDRMSGAVESFERSHGGSGSVFLKAAAEPGFAIASFISDDLLSQVCVMEVIDYSGQSVELQRASLGLAAPIDGNAAILGDRVIWNDFKDGRLRFYVVSTGERGTYD